MKYVRFYLEYESKKDKRAGKHSGNVFAAYVGNDIFYGMSGKAEYEGAGALFDRPNSPVCGTSASLEYLRDQCKRISEQEARKVHPELFVYLDEDE